MSWWMSFAKHLVARRALRDVMQFFEWSKAPQHKQLAWLLEKVGRERETLYGRDHDFAGIRTVEDFRRRVPIGMYDDFAPYVERVKQGDFEALFHRESVLMFALTSGTTNARKFVPVTKRYVDDYRRGWQMWGLGAFATHPHLSLRPKMVFVGDADEFRTEAGIPCGSISGLTASMQNRFVRRTYCLPAESAKIKDTRTKYYLAWRLGVMRDLGSWISPNPSTHVNLARFGDQHAEDLVKDVYRGGIHADHPVPPAVLRAARAWLRPDPRRARELQAILDRTGRLRPADVWPNLGLIGCWTGGSLGAYVRHFPEHFGPIAVRDIGLIASESRMTIPKEDGTAGGILDISSGFFEFVPAEQYGRPDPDVLLAHELQLGRDYYIVLTTSSGLCRYDIQDVVRCIDFHERTPILEFLHKGSQISNITGEKLSGHQVAQAVEGALVEFDLRLRSFALAPCWSLEAPWYGLFVEAGEFPRPDVADRLAAEIDRRLCEANCEYESKRTSDRLGPVRPAFLPDRAWDDWHRARIARSGGSAEQYKQPILITDPDFAESMPTISHPARNGTSPPRTATKG